MAGIPQLIFQEFVGEPLPVLVQLCHASNEVQDAVEHAYFGLLSKIIENVVVQQPLHHLKSCILMQKQHIIFRKGHLTKIKGAIQIHRYIQTYT